MGAYLALVFWLLLILAAFLAGWWMGFKKAVPLAYERGGDDMIARML